MEIKTYRLIPDVLAEKADKPDKCPKYHSYAYPLKVEVMPGKDGNGYKITYYPYHGTENKERHLINEMELDKSSLFAPSPSLEVLTQDYRSIYQYETEELKLEQEHNMPKYAVYSTCCALRETLQNAIAHLEMLGIVAGATTVTAHINIEYWINKESLHRVNSDDDSLEYRDLIRVVYTEITYNFTTPKILA